MKKTQYVSLNLLPLIALVISFLPFLIVGFPDGHDSSYGLVRVAEFKSSLVSEQFPPYWANNLYRGYGSPIFLFYAPLYLLVSAIVSVLAGSIAAGMMLAIITFSLVGIFGVKLMLEEALGKFTFDTAAASRVATYFLILNPYLLGDVFIRNAFSEYSALCLSPLALYGLLLIRRRPVIGGLILGMSMALIITAHNLTALTVFALLAAAGLFLYPPLKTPLGFWKMIVGSAGLGLALAAFFWAPAIHYVSAVRSDENVLGKFDFHNNFEPLWHLFGYDEFFSAGLLVPLVMVIAVGILLCSHRHDKLLGKGLFHLTVGCSLFFLFLQTRASVPIWETVPYMRYFQFPWRMMGPLALVTSIIAGLGFAYFSNEQPRKTIVMRELLLFLLCSVNAIPHLKVARPLPNQISENLSFMLKAENIRKFGLSATYSNEYLPRFADRNAWRSQRLAVGPVVHTTPSINLKVLEETGTKIILETRDQVPARLELARWAFPGWTCWINGAAHELRSNSIGALEVSVPAGLNRIVLELRPPLLRRISVWISLASLVAWAVMLIGTFRKNIGAASRQTFVGTSSNEPLAH
jgi:uncharacterized membrane protein